MSSIHVLEPTRPSVNTRVYSMCPVARQIDAPTAMRPYPPPQDPLPPSWPLTTPVQKAPCPDSHSRSSYGHSQPRTATPTPRSRSSSTSVYPSTPRQCYDRREVTVCHSKGKELMTGSAKPRLYWGYRDPRYPEVKGPTCWEPDRYGPY